MDIALFNNFPYDHEQEVIQKLHSDHLPVLIRIKINKLHLQPCQTTVNFNWNKLKDELQSIRMSTPTSSDPNTIDAEVTALTEAIKASVNRCRNAIVKKETTSIPDTARDLIKIRNNMRKRFQRTHDPNTRSTINKLQRIGNP